MDVNLILSRVNVVSCVDILVSITSPVAWSGEWMWGSTVIVCLYLEGTVVPSTRVRGHLSQPLTGQSFAKGVIGDRTTSSLREDDVIRRLRHHGFPSEGSECHVPGMKLLPCLD